jgi:hypothetical protein
MTVWGHEPGQVKCFNPAPLDLSIETRFNGFQIGPFEFVISSSSLGRGRNCSLLLPQVFGAQLGVAAKSIA